MRTISPLLLVKEMRRRRVFRTAGLYVVSAWLALQAANIVFPAWGIPDAALRYLILAVLLGFPVALVFGWIFEITPEGIRRTRPEWSAAELEEALPLGRKDYLILAAFVIVLGLIIADATGRVLRTTVDEEPLRVVAELMGNSVAVLPFASLSADPEHVYFADGISEEILNRLSAFGELTVIARTSSFTFKDSGYDIARISGLLGVEYLLQGSIRRDNGQIRIGVQLVDHRGAQLWTQTFDRELGAIFALQDEIAEAVATSIVPRIAPLAPIAREPDLEAYQEYLMGRELLNRRPAMFARDSAEHFTRAIELDPGYAEPYAARAVSRLLDWRTEGSRGEQLDQAQADIEMALSLKPDLGSAYAAQALLLNAREPDSLAQREALLRQAIALDPNHVDAMRWLSGTVFAQGHLDEAQEISRRASRIDPLHTAINVDVAKLAAQRGEFAAAERQFRRLAETPRASEMALREFYLFLLNTGQIAEALEIGKRQVMLNSPALGRGFDLWFVAQPYAMLGMVEQAEHWLARARREQPDYYTAALWHPEVLGIITGHLDYRQALAEFEAVLDAHGVGFEQLDPHRQSVYATLLSLSGAFEEASRTLPLPPVTGGTEYVWGAQGQSAIAWAYLRTGARDQAMKLVEPVIALNRRLAEAGRLHLGYDLYGHALAVLLSGDQQGALDLLERAADAGWRGYYGIRRDPRWDQVREHPKFQAIMTRLKADIDAQRAQVEALETDDDYEKRLDAAIAAHAAKASER